MSYSKWLVHDKCGWFVEPSMGDVWFTAGEYNHVCPRCGAPMPSDNFDVGRRFYSEWRLITAKPVRIRDGFLRWHTELRVTTEEGD